MRLTSDTRRPGTTGEMNCDDSEKQIIRVLILVAFCIGVDLTCALTALHALLVGHGADVNYVDGRKRVCR